MKPLLGVTVNNGKGEQGDESNSCQVPAPSQAFHLQHLILPTTVTFRGGQFSYYPHFTDEKTEAQRSKATCLKGESGKIQ